MKYIFFSLLTFVLASPVLAVTTGKNDGTVTTGKNVVDNSVSSGISIENPLEADSITALFQAILDIIMIFAIPIIVFFIVYAGFLYVTARGNAQTIQKAHQALLYAIIGALLVVGANVLIDVVAGTVKSFN